MGHIGETGNGAAVLLLHDECRVVEIPRPVGRILLGNAVEAEEGAFPHHDGVGIVPVRQRQQAAKSLPVGEPFSKVEAAELAVFHHLHDVTDFPVVEMKFPSRWMIDDWHSVFLTAHSLEFAAMHSFLDCWRYAKGGLFCRRLQTAK